MSALRGVSVSSVTLNSAAVTWEDVLQQPPIVDWVLVATRGTYNPRLSSRGGPALARDQLGFGANKLVALTPRFCVFIDRGVVYRNPILSVKTWLFVRLSLLTTSGIKWCSFPCWVTDFPKVLLCCAIFTEPAKVIRHLASTDHGTFSSWGRPPMVIET